METASGQTEKELPSKLKLRLPSGMPGHAQAAMARKKFLPADSQRKDRATSIGEQSWRMVREQMPNRHWSTMNCHWYQQLPKDRLPPDRTVCKGRPHSLDYHRQLRARTTQTRQPWIPG